MTRRFGWTMALALGLGCGVAMTSNDAHAKGQPRSWGGFGHAFGGIVGGDLGGHGSTITADSALGDGAGPTVFGGMLGGGGRVLLGRRLMLGGKGYALLTPPQQGSYGEARVAGGGGGLDVGVALYNNDNWLVYPYVGVQGLGLDLELTNESGQTRSIGNLSLGAGQSAQVSTGFPMLELGAGGQRLLFGEHHGGFIVGLELGFIYALGAPQWQFDGAPIDELGTAGLTGGYLRLTLGGGGFFDRGRRKKRTR